MQYVGKSETQFNTRLDNHTEDATRKENIPASNHFFIEGHDCNMHAKFILIEQLNRTNLDKLILRKRLKIRENF